MSDLGLNNHHTDVAADYLTFTKLQRVTNLKTIDGLFQDVFDSRLLDSSYTVDEVQDILYSLRKLVKGELESGLMDLNHMNILLLQQLFSQAERWHLRLELNLSELQNRSLLEKVRDIDQNGFAPLEERIQKIDDPSDPVSLLQAEIKRLKNDVTKYEEQVANLTKKLNEVTEESNYLHEKVDSQSSDDKNKTLKIAKLEQNIQNLKDELKDALNKNADKISETAALPLTNVVPDNLEEFKNLSEKLQQTQSLLKLAEQELQRKFKDTAAFINMKKLLDSKNDQIKLLREKLKMLEIEEANLNSSSDENSMVVN